MTLLSPTPPRSTFRFWSVTALAVLATAATLSLGRWQLSRAAQKETLQDRIALQGQLPALSVADINGNADPVASALPQSDDLLDRTLVVQGTWLPQYTVYLDNRQMDSKQGFFVLTPLKLESENRVIMVQRGWVQRNFTDRESLPPLITPAGRVQVAGRVARSPGQLLGLGKPESVAAVSGKSPSLIRQNLSLALFQSETQLPLWDHLLLQTDKSSDGLQRHWTAPSLGVEKHYGYAFQWFCLSALIALLYVWFQLVPRFRTSQPTR